MRNSRSWARVTALAASLTIIMAGLPAGSAFAQEAPSVALEQASSGEDGTTGSGANSGNTSSGNAERDKDGNGGRASAGSAGEGGTTGTTTSEEEALPENAELLATLGILELVTRYNLSVLDDSNISIELLPPPAAAPDEEAPADIETGGQAPAPVTSGDATIEEVTTGETSTISTEPGSGAAPTTGSTGAAAPDGIGATNNGDNRSPDSNGGNVYEAPGG